MVALALAVIYPFLKRLFWLPQAYLGVAFGFGIPMAFAAHQNHGGAAGVGRAAANMFWAIAYDTEYAMVDRDDDIRLGLKSSAILFGRHDVLAVMVCYALFLAIMVYVGYWARIGALLFLRGWSAAARSSPIEYLLIRGRAARGLLQGVSHQQLVGAAVFAGIVADFPVSAAVSGPSIGLRR